MENMYNISNYYIGQELNDAEYLLYSTLTTSMVTIEKDVYEDIFENRFFEKHPDYCEALEEMGFLFKGGKDFQSKQLESIRKALLEAEHGITSVTIAPTMECNARCYYCFENGAQKGRMTLETADKAADFLIENCKEKELYISWFGGEPLMAVDIIDRINGKLVDAGIHVESNFTTNGILINDNIIKLLKKWNVIRVQVTIDAIGEKYNRIKNYTLDIENPFEQVMRNVELLISNSFNVHLRVNYQIESFEEVSKTMKYLHNRFGEEDNIYLYSAPIEDPEHRKSMKFSEEEGETFLKTVKLAADCGYINDEINYRDLKVTDDYYDELGQYMLAPFPANCYMINKDRFVIDDLGILYKCQKHLGRKEYSCGDVFSGPKRNKIYYHYSTEKLKDKKCATCEILPICQGGCNANRLLYGEKFACPPMKTISKQLVKAYYDAIRKEED